MSNIYNLWQGATVIAPLGVASTADRVWHSGLIDASPAADKQYTSVRVYFHFGFNAVPAEGDYAEFAIATADEAGIWDGNIGASAAELDLAGTQKFRDCVTASKRVAASAANQSDYKGSFIFHDITPDWQLCIYGSVALAASPVLRYRYLNAQGQ